MQTNISRTITTALDNIKYDDHVKKALSNKYIIAHILKSVAEEFQSYSVQQIAEEFVDKDIYVHRIPLYPGQTNSEHLREQLSGDSILGDNVENKIPGEGVVTFDIRFKVSIPGNGKSTIKLFVNIEAQKEYYQKYELVTRAIVYAARMLSSQLDSEFKEPYYNGLKKVYSIWICMDVPKKYGNSITLYKIKKEDIAGYIPDRKFSYDKLAIAMIYLNENVVSNKKDICYMLNVLLSQKIAVSTKKQIFINEFGIQMNDDLGKELELMCNFGEVIEARAMRDGMRKGVRKGVRKGIRQGEDKMGRLVKILLDENRYLDASRITQDLEYRRELYKVYGI